MVFLIRLNFGCLEQFAHFRLCFGLVYKLYIRYRERIIAQQSCNNTLRKWMRSLVIKLMSSECKG